MQGWIKLHRKLIEWEWFHQSEMLHVFIFLLLRANHKDGSWQGIPVKKGQLITGRKRLSEETGLSEQKIRGCLNRLKSTSDITIQPTNRFSLITICNYCTYQPSDKQINQPVNQPPNQQLTNKQPTVNQQLTTNKNDKKEENEKECKESFVVFSNAHNLYPGNKRKILTEYNEFRGPDWQECIVLLLPAIEKQIAWRKTDSWRPPWKNFKNWLADREWEVTLTVSAEASEKDCVDCGAVFAEGHKFTTDPKTHKEIFRCNKCTELRNKK